MDFKIVYVVVVVALVELLKRFGVKGRWSMLAAVVIGAALGLTDRYVPSHFGDALPALLIGLTAAGLYDTTKAMVVRSGGAAFVGGLMASAVTKKEASGN